LLREKIAVKIDPYKDILEPCCIMIIVSEVREVLLALLREAEERLNRGELGLEEVGEFLSREGWLLVVSPVLLAAVLGLDAETARDVVDVLTDFSNFYVRGSGAVVLHFDEGVVLLYPLLRWEGWPDKVDGHSD
jgi:hypothetical protein